MEEKNNSLKWNLGLNYSLNFIPIIGFCVLKEKAGNIVLKIMFPLNFKNLNIRDIVLN